PWSAFTIPPLPDPPCSAREPAPPASPTAGCRRLRVGAYIMYDAPDEVPDLVQTAVRPTRAAREQWQKASLNSSGRLRLMYGDAAQNGKPQVLGHQRRQGDHVLAAQIAETASAEAPGLLDLEGEAIRPRE